jgi:uncharacterized YigZ family protein
MRIRYLTVHSFHETRMEIDKSLFITSVMRTETEDQITAFISTIRKTYPDANHHCFAYVAGMQDEFQKAEDGGEPSGTAGKPILEVLKKAHIKDTTVVVSRYFGGIKLGAGGLIRAYGKSAAQGIRTAGLIERILHMQIGVDIAYPLLGFVEHQLHVHGYTITDKQFTDQIRLFVLAQPGQETHLRQLIQEWTAGQVRFSKQGQAYVDMKIDF